MDFRPPRRKSAPRILPERIGGPHHARPRQLGSDKGFVGYGMITPFKKTRSGELLDLAEGVQHAGQQASLRDRAGHRELQDLADHLHRLPAADRNVPGNISAVVGLHFYKLA